ncbi:membrane protein [Enterobacterales bacterium]|nr:membrane protein [Enterobacterales bacterium]
MIILAVVAGAALSMQAAVNGKLGEKVGVLKSAFLTFSVGAAITAVLILFIQTPQAATLLTVPKWQLMGALFGVPYIIIMVTAVPRIGTAAATVAVILGQLSMGMMIDNFGWLHNPTIGLSWQRMAAVPCLAIALWLIYRSNRRSS